GELGLGQARLEAQGAEARAELGALDRLAVDHGLEVLGRAAREGGGAQGQARAGGELEGRVEGALAEDDLLDLRAVVLLGEGAAQQQGAAVAEDREQLVAAGREGDEVEALAAL